MKFIEYVNGKTFEKKRLEKIGDYTIFTVDASAIRNHSQGDDEFNHLATNLEFNKLVPDNEIWINRDIAKKERQFLIQNGINQYEGEKRGKKDWYDYALKKEKAEREKVDGIKFKPNARNEKPPQKIYYKHYCDIHSKGDDIKVWLIDGEMARDLYKSDFIEGGNSYVYGWVPKGEIWIEKNLAREKGEVDITILHEYIESTLMKLKKFTYDKAHNIAAKVDWHHRGKWSFNDVKSLNRQKALEMAKKYE